jgi:glycogen debranching enzyme
VTTYGLRSLAPDDPAYRGRHRGDRRARDGAYHQGTVWAWLIGPYLDAVLAVTGDRDAVRHALEPFEDQVADAAIGSISETFDGDPPHDPTGCIAQAWSVSEVLRLLHRVGPAEAASPPVSREGA